MAKYVIEIPDDLICDYVGSTHLLMPYIMAGHKGHHDTGLNLTPYTEPDRKAIELQHSKDILEVARMNYYKGAEDGWEFAKQVSIMEPEDKEECWGTAKGNTINLGYHYKEAKATYDKWKKDRIKVGDQVIYRGKKYFVVYVGDYNNYHLVDKNWIRVVVQHEKLKKTGRHSDLVVDLVKQLQEE